jgi:hypothetical protein
MRFPNPGRVSHIVHTFLRKPLSIIDGTHLLDVSCEF